MLFGETDKKIIEAFAKLFHEDDMCGDCEYREGLALRLFRVLCEVEGHHPNISPIRYDLSAEGGKIGEFFHCPRCDSVIHREI